MGILCESHVCIAVYVLLIETLKSVENVIITLEEYGVFTCEILGKYNDLKIRIDNGIQESSLVDPARGYFISLDNSTMNKTLAIQKVNITIKGLERNNNSLVECYDNTIGRHKTPKATLLIKGITLITIICLIIK